MADRQMVNPVAGAAGGTEHTRGGKSSWPDELLPHQTFVALGDHVGLYLFGGVDRHTHQDQQ